MLDAPVCDTCHTIYQALGGWNGCKTSLLPAETLLYHMMPWLGAFAKRYVLPVNGAVVSCLGLIFYAVHNRVGALGNGSNKVAA